MNIDLACDHCHEPIGEDDDVQDCPECARTYCHRCADTEPTQCPDCGADLCYECIPDHHCREWLTRHTD